MMTTTTTNVVTKKDNLAAFKFSNKMAAVEDVHLNMDGEGVDDVAEMLSLDKKKKKKKTKKVISQNIDALLN